LLSVLDLHFSAAIEVDYLLRAAYVARSRARAVKRANAKGAHLPGLAGARQGRGDGKVRRLLSNSCQTIRFPGIGRRVTMNATSASGREVEIAVADLFR